MQLLTLAYIIFVFIISYIGFLLMKIQLGALNESKRKR